MPAGRSPHTDNEVGRTTKTPQSTYKHRLPHSIEADGSSGGGYGGLAAILNQILLVFLGVARRGDRFMPGTTNGVRHVDRNARPVGKGDLTLLVHQVIEKAQRLGAVSSVGREAGVSSIGPRMGVKNSTFSLLAAM